MQGQIPSRTIQVDRRIRLSIQFGKKRELETGLQLDGQF